MKQIICFVTAFALIFSAWALAERTVYASQGGVSIYEENGLLGLMDEGENILLTAEYDRIYPFMDDEYILVEKDGMNGVVRRDGSVVLECNYDSIYIFKGTPFARTVHAYDYTIYAGLFNLEAGETIKEEALNWYWDDDKYIYAQSVGHNDGWETAGPYVLSVYDKDMKLISGLEGVSDTWPFAQGFVVWREEAPNAAVDFHGNEIISNLYGWNIVDGELYYSYTIENRLNNLLEGIKLGRDRLRRGLVKYLGFEWENANAVTALLDDTIISGILHADGSRMEIKADDILEKDAAGLYRAERNGLWGYVDEGGKWVLEPIYDEAYPFVDGAAVVYRKADESYRLIDMNGEQTGNAEWKNTSVFGLPLIPVENDGLRLLNRSGGYIGCELFHQANDGSCSVYEGHLLLRDSENRVCVVDMKGEVLLRLEIDEWNDIGSDRYLWAKEGDHWGLMDIFGENPGRWKIEPRFESYASLDESGKYISVSFEEAVLGSVLGEINLDGELLSPVRCPSR